MMVESLLHVLDTHALIWHFIDSERLRPALKRVIDETRRQGGRLLIPTIVLAEALDVSEKGKATFDFATMDRLIQEEAEFGTVDFGVEILDQALAIQEVREIHDRIIVATAKYYGASVLTRDRIIRDSGEVETIS